jgi:hypothetical protein
MKQRLDGANKFRPSQVRAMSFTDKFHLTNFSLYRLGCCDAVTEDTLGETAFSAGWV